MSGSQEYSSAMWAHVIVLGSSTWLGKCFILALTSAKGVSELLGFSYWIKQWKGWRSCSQDLEPLSTWSKIQVHYYIFGWLCGGRQRWNIALPHQSSKEITGLGSISFLVRICSSWILFRIKVVIGYTYGSATDNNCIAVKIKAYKVCKTSTGTSFLFKWSCAVQRVLKAGTWLSQTTFSAFYLRDMRQVYGHLFYWPCGGCSGHVAY